MHIADLSNDVLQHIFSFVDARDHLALMMTCKSFFNMYQGKHDELVWQRLQK
jgi:hypothetical protein